MIVSSEYLDPPLAVIWATELAADTYSQTEDIIALRRCIVFSSSGTFMSNSHATFEATIRDDPGFTGVNGTSSVDFLLACILETND